MEQPDDKPPEQPGKSDPKGPPIETEDGGHGGPPGPPPDKP